MVSSSFFIGINSIEKVSAATDNCFYVEETTGENAELVVTKPRPAVVQEMKLSLADFPIWDNEPLSIGLSLQYNLNAPGFPQNCDTTDRFFVRFEGSGFAGLYNIGSEPGTDISVTSSRTGANVNNPDKLVSKGTLTLPNITSALNTAAVQSVKRSTADRPFTARATVIYDSGISGPNRYVRAFGTKEFTIKPCLQPSVTDPNSPDFCKPHTAANVDDNNDTTIGNADELPLKDLSLTLNTSVEDKASLPANLKDEKFVNFIRVFKKNGVVNTFAISTNVGMTGPPSKNFKIPGSKAVFNVKKDSVVRKKEFKALGVGFTPAVMTSSESYGCGKSDITTSYLYGNDSYAYKFCSYAQSFETRSGVAMNSATDSAIKFRINISDSNLKDLKAYKSVTCKDGNCDSVYNEINVDTFYTLEALYGEDSGAFTLSDLNPGMFLYNRIRSAVTAANDLTITTYPKDKQMKFYIQIFENEDDFKANIDKPIPEGIPAYSSSTVGSGVKQQGAGETLYAFILKVIGLIVVTLQSWIYSIFAFIVVPIINALLQVRPYKDAFVSIIYPGWLILRNLANIFFILCLLVVGLKTLFQQSNTTAARQFIMRLVIFALLVNFSLVIGQGIVAIADTVQSQFLPGDTRVIEALGHKLMVEPLQNFRSEVTNSEDGQFTTELAGTGLSDAVKPIVLLILSVASFFAFLAIAAFLLVRLVMLWILYMLSPIAYVGFVMNETSRYAKQWWDEFIKWAIMTPILVFFLNIGALMALTFSTGSSDLAMFNKDGGIVGDVLVGSLTVLTHFVVLAFIYGGMMFATRFGGTAGKTIVKYAQKGFTNTFKKPAQWANAGKDYLSNKASDALEKRQMEGAAKGLSALTHPLQFGKAVKKNWIDDPGADRKKKEAERIGSIPFLTKGKAKGDPFKDTKAYSKEKEYGDYTAGDLQETLIKSMKDGKNKDGTASLFELVKKGEFDKVLESAKVQTGKTYSKNSAGINAAIDDMQQSIKFNDAQKEAFKKNVNSIASKDDKKSHYAGGVYLDKDGKFKSRKSDGSFEKDADGNPLADENGTAITAGKFTGDDAIALEKKQVERRVDMGLGEDLGKTNIDAMVARAPNGAIKGFTAEQIGVYADTNLNAALDDGRTNNNIRKKSNFNKLKEGFDAYKNQGDAGKQRFVKEMTDYATRQGKTLTESDAVAKYEKLEKELFNPKNADSGDGKNQKKNKKKGNKNNNKSGNDDDDGGDGGDGGDNGGGAEPVGGSGNPPVTPPSNGGGANLSGSTTPVKKINVTNIVEESGTPGMPVQQLGSVDARRVNQSLSALKMGQQEIIQENSPRVSQEAARGVVKEQPKEESRLSAQKIPGNNSKESKPVITTVRAAAPMATTQMTSSGQNTKETAYQAEPALKMSNSTDINNALTQDSVSDIQELGTIDAAPINKPIDIPEIPKSKFPPIDTNENKPKNTTLDL